MAAFIVPSISNTFERRRHFPDLDTRLQHHNKPSCPFRPISLSLPAPLPFSPQVFNCFYPLQLCHLPMRFCLFDARVTTPPTLCSLLAQ